MKRTFLCACLPLLLACGDEALPQPEPPPSVTVSRPRAEPPANTVGGFSVVYQRMVDPGFEHLDCWIHPLVVQGPSRVVGGGVMTASAGHHHSFVIARPKTGDGMRPCPQVGSLLEYGAGGAILFASSTLVEGQEWQSFPDGIGYPIDDDLEIVVYAHVVNPTSEPTSVTLDYQWFTIDEATVSHEIGPFAWVVTGWELPPQMETTVEATCELPDDMHVVHVMPHFHGRGTGAFAGFLDEEPWLDSGPLDSETGLITQYTPSLDIASGQLLRFGCSWFNESAEIVPEGPRIENEMCVIAGYAFPYEQSFSALSNSAGCAMLAPKRPE